MANEQKVNTSVTVENGNMKHTISPGQIQMDQAAQGAWAPVVSVSTSEEDLLPVDISTLGLLFLRNLDATNYVTYGPKTTGGSMQSYGRLEATDMIHSVRLEPGITMRWQANTANVKVQVWLFED